MLKLRLALPPIYATELPERTTYFFADPATIERAGYCIAIASASVVPYFVVDLLRPENGCDAV